jgi:hypothetical protein
MKFSLKNMVSLLTYLCVGVYFVCVCVCVCVCVYVCLGRVNQDTLLLEDA